MAAAPDPVELLTQPPLPDAVARMVQEAACSGCGTELFDPYDSDEPVVAAT